MKRQMTGIALVAIAMIAVGCSNGEQDATTQDGKEGAAKVVSYPLDICVVSDEKLGSMGKPYVIVYHGREVVFCCDGCEEDFRKEPAKFLAKIDAAAK